MPPLVGVFLLLLSFAAVELTFWVLRRWRTRKLRLARAIRALPASAYAGSAARVEALRPAPCVVLVHGLAGFDELRVVGRRAAYFRGVKDRLAARGVRCVVPRLPPVASIELRARALAAQLDALHAHDLWLVAHSMGGLDARFAIARHAPQNVRSLVTVATPHRGTPIAELGAWFVGGRFAELGALHDLVPARLAELEAHMPDAPHVHYGSVLVAPKTAPVHPLLVPTHRLLARWAGDNDGLVPVSSQVWGDVIGEVDTDHWGAVGWGGDFDAPGYYVSLIERLPMWSRADAARPWC